MRRSDMSSAVLVAVVLALAPVPVAAEGTADGKDGKKERKTVRVRAQTRPGGPVVEEEMAIHASPVDPAVVKAGEIEEGSIADDELVLGVVVGGVSRAYPIRYLALYEIVNDRLGGAALAPSW
jgi:Protein of unknown function (DUF3179)